MRARSSSRANMAALHRDGAFEIITFEGGFHGRTLATMSASGKKAFEPLFEPKVAGFQKAKLNDLASVEALINDNTVAVMLEPIQGEAGVWPATDQFLQELRALTDAHGLLLIFDEIQTGMGRTGKLFHYEHAGIAPDIMTLGKGIGGGVPLAALLATERASCFEHGDQGGTFNGNPLMCAVGLAVLERGQQAGLPEVGRPRPACCSKANCRRSRRGMGSAKCAAAGSCSRSTSSCRSRPASSRRRSRPACSSTRRSSTRCASCRR